MRWKAATIAGDLQARRWW